MQCIMHLDGSQEVYGRLTLYYNCSLICTKTNCLESIQLIGFGGLESLPELVAWSTNPVDWILEIWRFSLCTRVLSQLAHH